MVALAIEQEEARDERARAFGIKDSTVWHRQAPFWEIVRFAISGLASTIFYVVVAWLLVTLVAIKPVPASVLSYLLSLGVSYGLQSRFTFRGYSNGPGQVLKFLVTALLGLAASYTLVFLTTEVLHWWFVVGNIAVCIFIPLTNYFAFKLWVFGSAKRGARATGNE